MRTGTMVRRVVGTASLLAAAALLGSARDASACPEGTKLVHFTVTKEIYLFGIHITTVLYEEGWECRAT